MKATVNLLPRDDASLSQYKRLRPTWKGIASVTERFVVSQADHDRNTITAVSDGFWLLLNATLPEEARQIVAKNAEYWRGNGCGVVEQNLTLDDAGVRLNRGMLPAEYVSLRTERGKVGHSGNDDILVLRTTARDIGVNPRKARWIELWGEDKGHWVADAEVAYYPLQYIMPDGKMVGLLMPYAHKHGYWQLEKWGIAYDSASRMYLAA